MLFLNWTSFLGKRNDFTFKLNPKGTDFQQKSGGLEIHTEKLEHI
jgi:hypothetical protein